MTKKNILRNYTDIFESPCESYNLAAYELTSFINRKLCPLKH